jgi:translation initiation factor IF-3
LTKKFYRLNQYITAPTVRVVDEQGKQIGILPISEALKKAKELKADLVEVAPDANPPVCKIIDFKKFKYLEAKKHQEEKRKSKKVEIKEIRLTPFIAKNDFDFRIKRAEEFLKEGNKVKISVKFHGRQLTRKEFGYELIAKAKENLSPHAQVETEPKFVGNQLEVLLSPIQRGKNARQKNEN